MATRTGNVKPLQQLCVDEINSWLSLRTVLPLVRLEEEDVVLNSYPDLHSAARGFISDTFAALCEVEGREKVKKHISAELFEDLDAAEEQRRLELRIFKRRVGRVVERPPPPPLQELVELQLSTGGQGTDVAPDIRHALPTHPYSSLVAGVAWPPGVVADRREEHLGREEFEAVMGMQQAEFAAMPLWRQQQLKKDRQLF